MRNLWIAAAALCAHALAGPAADWPHDGKYGYGTRRLHIRNHLPRELWIEVQSGGSGPLKSDGFHLAAGADTVYEVPNVWKASRLWGRIDRAQTGPSTLIEWTMGKRDWYDISLVDGYNLPITITPVPGTYTAIDSTDPFDCGSISCSEDLLATCPEELRKTDGLGLTTQCLSACSRWNEDGYCCRGDFDSPETCRPSTWERNWPLLFKAACPTAVTYAFDDSSDTFICGAGPEGVGPDYEIGFGEIRASPVPVTPRRRDRLPMSREIRAGTWYGPPGSRAGPYDTRGRALAEPVPARRQ